MPSCKSCGGLGGDFKIIDKDNQFYLVQLTCHEDVVTAMLNGPWIIMGHCLSVQQWGFLSLDI